MNVKDTEDVEEFIKLRAQDVAFEEIAARLKVHPRTLFRWSRKYKVDINNLRAAYNERRTRELGLSRDQCQEILAEEMRRLREELARRDFKDIPTARVVHLLARLTVQAERFQGPIKLSEAIPESAFDEEELPDPVVTWEA